MKLFNVILFCCLIVTTVADSSYFAYPPPNSGYWAGMPIEFVATDVSHDSDVTIRVTLHSSRDGRLVQVLNDFRGKEVATSGENFMFTWVADAPDGTYYIKVTELEEEDEDGESEDEDDDENRSYDFRITTYRPAPYAPY